MSVSNSAVCHAWAHSNKAQATNLRTDGKRLISYNTDVGYNTGRGLVFLSDNTMSPSTGKQLSVARRSVHHLDVVYTPVFEYGRRIAQFDESEAFNLACNALNARLEGYSKARLSKQLHSSIAFAVEETHRLNSLAYKYNLPVWNFHEVSAEKMNAARAYADQFTFMFQQRQVAASLKAYKRQEELRERDAAEFETWRTGSGRCPASYRHAADGGYYIAVHGDKVVTSGGAECPVGDAVKGLMVWKDARANNTTWHRNGHTVKLGIFQLDRIAADGTAYAGCHRFNVAELERLAAIIL